MCLHADKNTKCCTAGYDIYCYKGMLLKDDSNIQTPTFRARITKDIIDGKEDFVPNGDEMILLHQNELVIGSGFIHTYKCISDARQKQRSYSAKKGYSYKLGYRYRIFQCVIPKGTKYYEGETYRHEPSYAAKKIRFIEKV